MLRKADTRRKARRSIITGPKAFLFGDSHSYAVERAAERRVAKGLPVPVSVHRRRKEKGAITIGDTSLEEFLELVSPLADEDLVVTLVGGNQHAVFSTIQHAKRFDFLEPQAGPGSLDPDAEIIPSRILSGLFDRGIRGRDGHVLEQLRKETGARVVHVLPPPPKRDNEFISRYHEAKFAQENIAALGVSSPELRMKFWRLQARLLEKLCAELNI